MGLPTDMQRFRRRAFRSASSRSRRAIVVVGVAALLGAPLVGCISTIGPQVEGVSPVDAGPFPDGYEQIVAQWIQDRFHFYSRIENLRISEPEPGLERPPILSLRGTRYGWWTLVIFRALDRVGASTGRISYALLIRDGEIVAHQKQAF